MCLHEIDFFGGLNFIPSNGYLGSSYINIATYTHLVLFAFLFFLCSRWKSAKEREFREFLFLLVMRVHV